MTTQLKQDEKLILIDRDDIDLQSMTIEEIEREINSYEQFLEHTVSTKDVHNQQILYMEVAKRGYEPYKWIKFGKITDKE